VRALSAQEYAPAYAGKVAPESVEPATFGQHVALDYGQTGNILTTNEQFDVTVYDRTYARRTPADANGPTVAEFLTGVRSMFVSAQWDPLPDADAERDALVQGSLVDQNAWRSPHTPDN